MIPYWLILVPLAVFALNERTTFIDVRRSLGVGGHILIVLLTIVIGYRYEVGGDWYNYVAIFDSLEFMTISEAISSVDIAYAVINYISMNIGWGVIGVNVVCAGIFSLGLVNFCWQQPRPLLSLVVSVPYLVIVVGMGYSRQAVAIGCAMLGLVALEQKRNIYFMFWIIIAALFHRSSAVLLPIFALMYAPNRKWTAAWVIALFIGVYILVLRDAADTMMLHYVENELQSEGALVRVLMSAVPAALFLLLRRRFKIDPDTKRLWTWLSAISLGSLALLMAMPAASTAIDRMALYLIPIQLFVLSRLPEVVFDDKIDARVLVCGIVAYSVAVQFIWLNFAVHAHAWVPYKFYLLESL